MPEQNEDRKFTIFRADEAPGLMESGCMTMAPMTDVEIQGIRTAVGAGYLEGDEIKVLVNMPGFSLAYAWLKKDYPLALHSHDSDCLYYVVAGSLKIGTEQLGPRDSFFVPADVPYTYRPGPAGVEILEFRHATQFNFLNRSKSAAFWTKAAETCAQNVEDWKCATRPSVAA